MNKVLEEVPENFDFEALKWGAVQILSSNSLTTLASMCRVSSIERADNYIKTACIGRRGKNLVISYNGEFIYNYASKPIEFAGIIAHEIFHEILDHLNFNRYRGNHKLWNIAQDCIIQSTLARMNRPPKRNGDRYKDIPDSGFHITSVMEGMYSLVGEESLLRPPNPIRRIGRRETSGDIEVDNLRQRLYPETGSSIVNEIDIYNFIKNRSKILESITLIGESSSDTSKDSEEGNCKVPDKGKKPAENSGEATDKAEEDKDRPKKGIGNLLEEATIIDICEEVDKRAGHSSVLTEKARRVIKRKSAYLEAALDQALVDSVKAKIVAGIGINFRPLRSVIIPADLTRSDLLQICTGSYPFFFSKRVHDVKKAKVNIYIDVSGSCDSYIDWMYGCILDLTRIAEIRCFLFSNKVVEISMEDIRKGKIVTTGGTDFDCIIEHSLLPENITEVKKSIIFTDGCAHLSADLMIKAKKNDLQYIGAAFSGDYSVKYDQETRRYITIRRWETVSLKTFCSQVFEIPYMEDESGNK